ncbi:MAG: hypothetical protein IJZ23_02325 [Roseburia sp.]|nr:hypothetical protein [Roseburia sp.]
MNKKVTGIVSYFTWIGWLVAFLAGDKEGAKFHLNQSLVLMIANLLNSVLAWVGIPWIPSILSLVLLVFWILGLVYAIKEENKELPLIGGIKILK